MTSVSIELIDYGSTTVTKEIKLGFWRRLWNRIRGKSTTKIIREEIAGLTAAETQKLLLTLNAQGITELTIRINAFTDWNTGMPNAQMLASAKAILTAAPTYGLSVNVDIHTWYTTWDTNFRNGAANYLANRTKYIAFLKNTITAFNGYAVKAFMILNEPQARTATPDENQFIRDVIAAAKSVTSVPVAVRYMGGYSPSTKHYADDLNGDMLCRNVYWDARNPSAAKYGITNATMDQMIADASAKKKPLWITEFGITNSIQMEQANYVKAFVAYAKSKKIDKVFGWVAKVYSSSAESFSFFNGFAPLLAYYELKNDVPTPTPPPTTTQTTTMTTTITTKTTTTKTTTTITTQTSSITPTTVPPDPCKIYKDDIVVLQEQVSNLQWQITTLNGQVAALTQSLHDADAQIDVDDTQILSLNTKVTTAIAVLQGNQ